MKDISQVVEDFRVENEFKFNGDLTKKKLWQYFPAMLITNISTLLLVSVDGLVVGNFCRSDALSSVNIFSPATLAIGIISVLLSSGISARMSEGMGQIDLKGLLKTKSTLRVLMIIAAIFVAVVQIPIVAIIISSYSLSPEMNSLVWSYAIGVMISMPFGLISTIGVLQLQIVGKMKVLMGLACLEGGVNLILDLLFVGPLDMGVAGVGYGTLCANLIRSIGTVVYLYKKTDMLSVKGIKCESSDYIEIFRKGLPESSSIFVNAIIGYMMAYVIILYFGDEGGVINGVTSLCYAIISVVMRSIQGGISPLVGCLEGIDDRRGIRLLLQQGIALLAIFGGIISYVYILFPEWFFMMQGVDNISDVALESVRIYSTCFVATSVNALFRVYFSSQGLHKFSSTLTIIGNLIIPALSFVIGIFFEPQLIWISYSITAYIILVINIVRYAMRLRVDKDEEANGVARLYLSVKPEDALKASRDVHRFVVDNGYSKVTANRVRLCMEEMVAYSVKTAKSRNVNNQIMFCFTEDETRFVMLDDGECIAFDSDKEDKELMIDNYSLIKTISTSVKYQFLLNLNYTLVCFEEEKIA